MIKRAPNWISQTEWNALHTFIPKIQKLLHLQDWEITLSENGTDNDSYGSILPISGTKRATLFLDRNWSSRLEDQKVRTIIHELIHCHFAQSFHIIQHDLPRELSQSAYNLLWASFLRASEYGIDGMTDAISKFAPPYKE